MKNLCVISEDGLTILETRIRKMFRVAFHATKEQVTFDKGLEEIKEYAKEHLGDDTALMDDYNKKEQKFIKAVAGKEGTFWIWHVEYDLSLMFLNAGEVVPLD